MDLGVGALVVLRAESTAILDPLEHLLLLVVLGGPRVRYVYLCCCVSGGRWRSGGEEGGSIAKFGVESVVLSASFPGFAYVSRISFGFQLSYERVDVLRVSGDVLFVCAVGFPRIGIFVSAVMELVAVDSVFFFSSCCGGRFSFIVYDACWMWFRMLALAANQCVDVAYGGRSWTLPGSGDLRRRPSY